MRRGRDPTVIEARVIAGSSRHENIDEQSNERATITRRFSQARLFRAIALAKNIFLLLWLN
jgi:hypothetical protein